MRRLKTSFYVVFFSVSILMLFLPGISEAQPSCTQMDVFKEGLLAALDGKYNDLNQLEVFVNTELEDAKKECKILCLNQNASECLKIIADTKKKAEARIVELRGGTQEPAR